MCTNLPKTDTQLTFLTLIDFVKGKIAHKLENSALLILNRLQ